MGAKSMKKEQPALELPLGWWPDFIPPIGEKDFIHRDQITVAEVEQPSGPESYRHIYTALVPLDLVEMLLSKYGAIGNQVEASGPHPSADMEDGPRQYKPRFWIFGGEIARDGFEPLVVAWRSSDKTILSIDQGFLMTYALMPRFTDIREGHIEVHWDDLAEPVYDVISTVPISKDDYPRLTPAWVKIRRDYLEDYSFLRGQALVQVFYMRSEGFPGKDTDSILAGNKYLYCKSPGMEFRFRMLDESRKLYSVQAEGVRLLLNPTKSPVSAGRWDYGKLKWPGFPEPFSDHSEFPPGAEVFVRDSVLENYEGKTEYSIHPEHGGVSFKDQWAVSYVRRAGKDLLAVEVRKLYEGCPPAVVRLWNKYAVEPLPDDQDIYGLHPNVASRAKDLTYALLAFGEALAFLQTIILNQSFSSMDTVGIPIDMTENAFLDRCEALCKMLIECFKESDLRKIMEKLGCSHEKTREFGSLLLLNLLINLCQIAAQSGLQLLGDSTEVLKRFEKASEENCIPHLFALYELRKLKSHRSELSRPRKLKDALDTFGIEKVSTVPGWGSAADRVYDALIDELVSCQKILGACIIE
jgi:hypothetical protein